MRIIFALCISILTLSSLIAQETSSPVGLWQTIDDKTGKAKSEVEIYEQSGKFYAKVVKLLLKPADTICDKCAGAKKNKPVVGMVILEDLKPYKYYWKYGTILDPENGSTYGCSVWYEDGKSDELKVRGKHWTGIFRTQTWHRIK